MDGCIVVMKSYNALCSFAERCKNLKHKYEHMIQTYALLTRSCIDPFNEEMTPVIHTNNQNLINLYSI